MGRKQQQRLLDKAAAKVKAITVLIEPVSHRPGSLDPADPDYEKKLASKPPTYTKIELWTDANETKYVNPDMHVRVPLDLAKTAAAAGSESEACKLCMEPHGLESKIVLMADQRMAIVVEWPAPISKSDLIKGLGTMAPDNPGHTCYPPCRCLVLDGKPVDADGSTLERALKGYTFSALYDKIHAMHPLWHVVVAYYHMWCNVQFITVFVWVRTENNPYAGVIVPVHADITAAIKEENRLIAMDSKEAAITMEVNEVRAAMLLVNKTDDELADMARNKPTVTVISTEIDKRLRSLKLGRDRARVYLDARRSEKKVAAVEKDGEPRKLANSDFLALVWVFNRRIPIGEFNGTYSLGGVTETFGNPEVMRKRVVCIGCGTQVDIPECKGMVCMDCNAAHFCNDTCRTQFAPAHINVCSGLNALFRQGTISYRLLWSYVHSVCAPVKKSHNFTILMNRQSMSNGLKGASTEQLREAHYDSLDKDYVERKIQLQRGELFLSLDDRERKYAKAVEEAKKNNKPPPPPFNGMIMTHDERRVYLRYLTRRDKPAFKEKIMKARQNGKDIRRETLSGIGAFRSKELSKAEFEALDDDAESSPPAAAASPAAPPPP